LSAAEPRLRPPPRAGVILGVIGILLAVAVFIVNVVLVTS